MDVATLNVIQCLEAAKLTLCRVANIESRIMIKRNEFESVLVRWMNLESVMLSEVSKSEREEQISYINTYIWIS